MTTQTTNEIILQVKNLQTHFHTEDGLATAVDGVSFTVRKGETLCLVGESGCGKSVTALSILRLVQSPPGEIVGGEIWFEGRDILTLNSKELREIRGNQISMIFQEPMTALNPVFTVGAQIAEVFLAHQKMKKSEARGASIKMLEAVRIPSPESRFDNYPHEMSGGMRQRVMIAMALACKPRLLIADEPTTALDVTVQAQILALMEQLKEELNTAVILITHDLGVVAEVAQQVAVMYAGEVVEMGSVEAIFANPLHPYTQCLHKAVPTLEENQEKLFVIEGSVPSPLHFPAGCRFHPRCPYRMEICEIKAPPRYYQGAGNWATCHLHEGKLSTTEVL